MTNTADFGIGYSVNFGNLNVNLQSLNGEGYKNTDADGNQSLYMRLLYGEGSLNKNTGYNFGVVISSFLGDVNADMYGLFAGWSSEKVRLGFENSRLKTLVTENAFSFYINYSICDSWDVFFRSDNNDEDIDDILGAETLSILGSIWNPTKGLYIAPNLMIGEDGDHTYRVTCMFKY